MSDKKFSGPLAGYLEGLTTERRNLGYKFGEEERLLHELDRMSIGYDCTGGLSEELVRAFTNRKPNWHQGTQAHHINVSRLLALYMIRHNIPAFLIDFTSITNLHEDYKPYIFTHEEIKLIFSETDHIKENTQNTHYLYPVLLRAQYCCGLRISETLSLRMKDVDMEEKIFHVHNAKNNKDRDIPFTDSLCSYLNWYMKKIHTVYNEDDFFFKSRWGNGHYNKGSIEAYFRKILFRCGIPHGGRKNGGPHLHCLRHTFCCHSLEKMLENGLGHQAALPLLQHYLGHTSLSATGRYLKLTAEAFPNLQSKINEMYADILPSLHVRYDYEEDN